MKKLIFLKEKNKTIILTIKQNKIKQFLINKNKYIIFWNCLNSISIVNWS